MTYSRGFDLWNWQHEPLEFLVTISISFSVSFRTAFLWAEMFIAPSPFTQILQLFPSLIINQPILILWFLALGGLIWRPSREPVKWGGVGSSIFTCHELNVTNNSNQRLLCLANHSRRISTRIDYFCLNSEGGGTEDRKGGKRKEEHAYVTLKQCLHCSHSEDGWLNHISNNFWWLKSYEILTITIALIAGMIFMCSHLKAWAFKVAKFLWPSVFVTGSLESSARSLAPLHYSLWLCCVCRIS